MNELVDRQITAWLQDSELKSLLIGSAFNSSHCRFAQIVQVEAFVSTGSLQLSDDQDMAVRLRWQRGFTAEMDTCLHGIADFTMRLFRFTLSCLQLSPAARSGDC